MTYLETALKPVVSKTEPRPLDSREIKANSSVLSYCNVELNPDRKSFSRTGLFFLSNGSKYWSKKLLPFDNDTQFIKTYYGNLLVYDIGDKPPKQRTKILPEDVRRVDYFYNIRGVVSPLGFVLPKSFPHLPSEHNLGVSREQLENLLLNAEKTKSPQLSYFPGKSYAKVDPKFAGEEVVLIPFCHGDKDELGRVDAVVVGKKKKNLMPHTFINAR